jgi:hypothetical protein
MPHSTANRSERVDASVRRLDDYCECDVDLLDDDELEDDPCPRCGGRVWAAPGETGNDALRPPQPAREDGKATITHPRVSP